MDNKIKVAIFAAIAIIIILYFIFIKEKKEGMIPSSLANNNCLIKTGVNITPPYMTDLTAPGALPNSEMDWLFKFQNNSASAGGTVVPLTKFAAWPNLFDTYAAGTYGTVYTNSATTGIPEDPTMIVVMFIGEDCCQGSTIEKPLQCTTKQADCPSTARMNNLRNNPLIGFFTQVEREFLASQIKFIRIIVPAGTKTTLPLPRIFKYRQNGQILEYKGHNDFGELYDWVMEENQLF